MRCALHTGLAEQRDHDYFGPTLSRLARLLAHAQGGETLLTASTFEIEKPQARLIDDEMAARGKRRRDSLMPPLLWLVPSTAERYFFAK